MQLYNLLKQTSIYQSFRDIWMRRNYELLTSEDRKKIRFYSQFITPGSLCFDVGANLGNRTKCFAALCGKVIAFEPQSRCFEYLNFLYKYNDAVDILPYALGEKDERLSMMLSQSSTTSSLSEEWIQRVQASGRFGDRAWVDVETVEVKTLDAMVRQYGIPEFCKIDVEGFEHKVITGLSQPLKYLSFEFTPEYFESTHACIQHLISLGPVEFNYSLGESMKLELEQWISSSEILKLLQHRSQIDQSFGDIYAHFI